MVRRLGIEPRTIAYVNHAGEGGLPLGEEFGRAREAAERALHLEPYLPEGHLALGRVRLYYDWDWKGAESSVLRALELAPGNARVISAAAGLTSTMGRHEEAIALDRRAAALDPLSSRVHFILGFHCLHAGLLDGAEEEVRKAIEISPQGAAGHEMLGVVHLAQGRLEEALTAMEREPHEPTRLLGLALVYHAKNRTAESDAALRELIEKYAQTHAVEITTAYAYRGDADRAFEWLERAYVQRDPGLVSLKCYPLLRGLHADPRWQPFLEKMGLAG